ncbi:MAG: glycine betaine ABC transporter ATP-binding protein [Desulfitibacter sp. BRH_c19]|nr:MAG: glycine betaine ABC transporter ATP-binding protein [Desulfitibacter sp. BRH_c19]
MIRFKNVTKIFVKGNTRAVDDLSLDVPKGNICVLVGPSGCGKTTSMRMVNRLIEPTHGEIYINGQESSKIDPIKLRLDIGYVIQGIGLFPHMSIADNVATVLKEKKWPMKEIKPRVDELLQIVGLDPEIYRYRRPSALSGGQRQRVGVARGMAAKPPIMLMDEPFGAVDPITRAKLQNEFLRLQAQMKKTIIFVTHDIDEAIKMGDMIAVLSEGKLVQYSTPDQLLSMPVNDFVISLVGRNRSIKRLHLMRIREVVKPRIPIVSENEGIDNVKELLASSELGIVAVCSSNGKFKGIVTKEDLKDDAQWVGDACIATENCIEEGATLNDALSLMLNFGESYIVVLNKEGELLGAISIDDIFKAVKPSEE